MSSSVETVSAAAVHVDVDDTSLTVQLSDGRTIVAPVAWFPRLSRASPAERSNWRFIGKGHGIHWPDLDEDISVDGLLAGKASGESQTSLKRWLDARSAKAP